MQLKVENVNDFLKMFLHNIDGMMQRISETFYDGFSSPQNDSCVDR